MARRKMTEEVPGKRRDSEVEALRKIFDALDKLSLDEKARVVAYLIGRLT